MLPIVATFSPSYFYSFVLLKLNYSHLRTFDVMSIARLRGLSESIPGLEPFSAESSAARGFFWPSGERAEYELDEMTTRDHPHSSLHGCIYPGSIADFELH